MKNIKNILILIIFTSILGCPKPDDKQQGKNDKEENTETENFLKDISIELVNANRTYTDSANNEHTNDITQNIDENNVYEVFKQEYVELELKVRLTYDLIYSKDGKHQNGDSISKHKKGDVKDTITKYITLDKNNTKTQNKKFNITELILDLKNEGIKQKFILKTVDPFQYQMVSSSIRRVQFVYNGVKKMYDLKISPPTQIDSKNYTIGAEIRPTEKTKIKTKKLLYKFKFNDKYRH